MLKARTKDQLDSTTKRTIMENEQMACPASASSSAHGTLKPAARAPHEAVCCHLFRHLHYKFGSNAAMRYMFIAQLPT
eukprot:2972234-Amphidinium_carterae.1